MKIIDKKELAPGISQFLVEAPLIAKKAEPGNFIVLRHKENGERIPLTIADFDRERGTITLVCQGIGKSTKEINQMQKGDTFLDLLGPLGTAYPIKKIGTVACVAGGLGVAPLYPKAKALHQTGNRVLSLIGAQRKEMLIMTEELTAVSDVIQFSTDDGSFGHHGFVTDLLRQALTEEEVHEIVAVGPVPMMAATVKVAKEFKVPIVVSLNALMIDGTGMCGGCRVTIGGETKFCCVDGPAFDGALVNFEELTNRQRYYHEQEQEALHRCRLEEAGK